MSKKIIIDALEQVACPHCDKEFALQDAITNQLIDRYENEYESTLNKEKERLQERIEVQTQRVVAKKFEDKISDLTESLAESKTEQKKTEQKIERAKQIAAVTARKEAEESAQQLKIELEAKDEKLAAYRETEMALRKEKAALLEQQKELALEVQRQVDSERKRIEEVTADTYRLREAEWRKKIDDAQLANEDLKRKLEQGSQQLQGEVLELEIEELLRDSFPFDAIEPVKKGARGADVIHTVNLRSGATCGKIIWETKRAENWSNSWIPKLKDDSQTAGGEIAVLVSTAFPANIDEPMLLHEGVWLVTPELVRPLAEALRSVLVESHRQKSISAGKDESMEALFNYITGAQFAQKVRAVVDAYQQMRDDLDKERNAMQRLWKKREGQLARITTNMIGMCGDLQGISGSGMPQLDGIAEFPELGSDDEL